MQRTTRPKTNVPGDEGDDNYSYSDAFDLDKEDENKTLNELANRKELSSGPSVAFTEIDRGAHEKPVEMPGIGYTTEFPRTDNVFKKKESLAYDEAQSNVWINRPKDVQKEIWIEWSMMFLIGFCVGSTAYVMKVIEEELIKLCNELT